MRRLDDLRKLHAVEPLAEIERVEIVREDFLQACFVVDRRGGVHRTHRLRHVVAPGVLRHDTDSPHLSTAMPDGRFLAVLENSS
jgi:hypothetical protein